MATSAPRPLTATKPTGTGCTTWLATCGSGPRTPGRTKRRLSFVAAGLCRALAASALRVCGLLRRLRPLECDLLRATSCVRPLASAWRQCIANVPVPACVRALAASVDALLCCPIHCPPFLSCRVYVGCVSGVCCLTATLTPSMASTTTPFVSPRAWRTPRTGPPSAPCLIANTIPYHTTPRAMHFSATTTCLIANTCHVPSRGNRDVLSLSLN